MKQMVKVEKGENMKTAIPVFSEKVFDALRPLAVDLVGDVHKKYGARMAANVLTNALVSTTAWQFGNQMGFQGKWDSDQERQDYCTKISKKLFLLLETEKPKTT